MPFSKLNPSPNPRRPKDVSPGLYVVVPATTSLKSRIRRGFVDRLLFTAIWLPAGMLGIYAKGTILAEKQWCILAHAFHRPSNFPAAQHFSILQRTALFSSDCILGLCVIPFTLVAVLTILPRKVWSVAIASIGISISLIVFLQMQSFKNVGHFIPWYLISDGFHWATQHPEYIIAYGSGLLFLKFATLIGTIVILAVFLHRSQNLLRAKPRLAQVSVGIVAACAVVGSLFGAVLGAGGTTGKLAHTWYGRAAIPVILSATLMGNEDIGTGASVRSTDDLYKEYAAIANSEKGAADQRFWATASGCDVIMVILETAPAKYDSFDQLDDLPALKQLASRSWVGSSHYSTFPYTSKATFSILTSMYPPNPLFFGGRPKAVPGLVRALSSAGYATRYYVPHPFENHFEDAMFGAIGFDKIFTSDPPPGALLSQHQYEEDRVRRDVDALHALTRDVHDLAQQPRPFLAVFSPQVGHAPWLDLENGDSEKSLGMRARALLRLQDKWLGQIVEQLVKDGRLDKTIIVVTGDHGVRTAVEDPAFEPHGLLSNYSFHVPLLIFAPQALKDRQTIRAVTSHIDITPTLLDLLGITQNRAFEQGLPVWLSEGNRRKVFSWAGDYLGADGFAQAQTFAVWNRVGEYVFSGPSLDDEVLRMAAVGSEEQTNADECLRAMSKLNGDWWVSATSPSNNHSGGSP